MYPHKGAFPPMGGAPNIASNNLPNAGDTQWMSQSAYQNIDLDKVDWAALAQQWIHMKESTGPVASSDPIPNAPPPPRFTNTVIDYEEQGEAPMEVEHDEEQLSNENSVNLTAPPPPTNVFNQSNQWNSEPNSRGSHQKQWNRSMLKLPENLKKNIQCIDIFRRKSLEFAKTTATHTERWVCRIRSSIQQCQTTKCMGNGWFVRNGEYIAYK